MQIVVNKCFGGFSLSALAVKRLAELNGKECYFFRIDFKNGESIKIPTTIDDISSSLFFSAYTVANPDEYTENDKRWHEMSSAERDEYNKKYEEIHLPIRPKDRTDKLLLQVVE